VESQKKLSAAIAGVMAYMREEDCARVVAPPRLADTAWSLYSRQTIMNNRATWQGTPLTRKR